MKKTIECNPEFGCEIICAVPYVNYLYQNNQLEKVRTVKDMKPFYYFLPDNMVEESFNARSLDNNVALKDVPNNWIHHNAKAVTGKDYSDLSIEEQHNVNGVLDYSEWVAPDYRTKFSNKLPKFTDKPYVVILNKFTLEHNNMPIGFFDMNMLQQMLEHFTNKGYAVVYRRPSNNDYAPDLNELNSAKLDLINKYGIKAYDSENNIIDDKDLMNYYEDCFVLDDLFEQSSYTSRNEFELSLYSDAEGFVTVNGGNCILASIFGKPVVVYACEGKELRPNYFNDNCYFKQFANASLYPIIDPAADIKLNGTRRYEEVLNTIKQVFK
jgi:hypothetical protein